MDAAAKLIEWIYKNYERILNLHASMCSSCMILIIIWQKRDKFYVFLCIFFIKFFNIDLDFTNWVWFLICLGGGGEGDGGDIRCEDEVEIVWVGWGGSRAARDWQPPLWANFHRYLPDGPKPNADHCFSQSNSLQLYFTYVN